MPSTREVVIARRKQPLGNVKSACDQNSFASEEAKACGKAERSVRRTRRMDGSQALPNSVHPYSVHLHPAVRQEHV